MAPCRPDPELWVSIDAAINRLPGAAALAMSSTLAVSRSNTGLPTGRPLASNFCASSAVGTSVGMVTVRCTI